MSSNNKNNTVSPAFRPADPDEGKKKLPPFFEELKLDDEYYEENNQQLPSSSTPSLLSILASCCFIECCYPSCSDHNVSLNNISSPSPREKLLNFRRETKSKNNIIRMKNWLGQHHKLVLAFSLLVAVISIALAVVGAIHIKGFISHTTEILDPPRGTDAYNAKEAFKTWMPEAAEVSYFNVFVTFKGTYFTKQGDNNNNQNNITEIPTLCSFLKALEVGLASNPKTMHHYQHMGDFCQLIKMNMFKIGDHLIAPDKTSVTAPITCNVSRFAPAAKLFGEGLEEIVAETVKPYLLNATAFEETHQWTYVPTESDFVVGINGLSTFLTSIAETSKKDLMAAMRVVMPILLVLVILRFRGSFGLTFAALFVAGGHFCSSFGIMRPIDDSMEVSSPTPLLMFCLGIGLSLMFSIVILTQFSQRSREYFDPLLILMKKGRNNNHTNTSTTSKKIAKMYSTTESIVIVGQEESVDTGMKTRLHYSIVTTPMPKITTTNNQNQNQQHSVPIISEQDEEEDLAEREFDSILEQDVQFHFAMLNDVSLAVKSNWPSQYQSFHHYYHYHCHTTPNYSARSVNLAKVKDNNAVPTKSTNTIISSSSKVPTLQNLPSSIETTATSLAASSAAAAPTTTTTKNQNQEKQQQEYYSTRKITNVEHARCDILVDVFMATAPAITIATVTLLCSMCVTVFFPASIIQSLGIGCMMTVLASWLYSVPILFCLLYLAFPFFVYCSYPTTFWYKFSGFLRGNFMPACLFGEGQCWACALGCDDYAVGIDDEDQNEEGNYRQQKRFQDDNEEDDDGARTPPSGEHSPLLSTSGDGEVENININTNNSKKSNKKNNNFLINHTSSNYLRSSSTNGSTYYGGPGATGSTQRGADSHNNLSSCADDDIIQNQNNNNNYGDDDEDEDDNDANDMKTATSSASNNNNNQHQLQNKKKNNEEQGSPAYSNYSSMANETLHRERKSLIRHAKQLLRLIILLLLVAFFIVVTTRMTLSNSYTAYLGRHSSVTIDFLSFVQNYGYGMTSPYRVLFTVTKDDSKWLWTNESIRTVWSKTFWIGAQQVVSKILEDPILGNETHMAGPLVIGPVLQDFQVAWDCIIHKNGCDDDSILAFLGSQISADSEAMFLMMTAKFDPLGKDGWDMYQRILSKLQPETNDYSYSKNGTITGKNLNGPHRVFDVYLEGSGPSSLDCVHAIYDRVPYLAPIAVAVGVLVIFFTSSSSNSSSTRKNNNNNINRMKSKITGSLLNALRFAIGLSACLSATLALPTLVYQYGWLDWTNIETLKTIGDTPWIMPIIVFAVSLGLSTAFDVLWVMMICRNRKFHESGSLYFLGLVVFVAMFGLSMSDVPLMNAVGFSCCTAVIFASVIVPNALTIPSFEQYRIL